MKNKLKDYIYKTEHLNYSSRIPVHASLFENKAMLSKFAWDIHSYNAKKYYKKINSDHSSTLEKYGYLTGNLDKEKTNLLRKIYSSCKKITFNPFDFDSDYVYEPRKNLHDDMVRINNYYQPSKFFFNNMPFIIDPLKEILEKENQFYWKVASSRIFEVKPVNKTQGFHKDDQALAIKKLFFFPDGANKNIGSTNLKDKFNKEIIIDLEPGSWLMFENSLCEHQAYSSEKNLSRPTIEIDIMPDFITDTTLNYSGINSWYPWYPIFNNEYKLNGSLDYDEVCERNLKRLAGLCSINKTDYYKFPCEFSDFYNESADIFKINIGQNIDNTTHEHSIKYNITKIVNENGLLLFLYSCIKTIPIMIIKKILKKIK
tara:strand:+ start:628 stop:1743 length:1116 start_codon:yes stop_codon:yes gene_type:complete